MLSLGTISKFYRLIKQPDQQAVGREFRISESQLLNMIGLLSLIRNKCAHDERIFDFKSRA